MVVGAHAVWFHGLPRQSADLDIVLFLKPDERRRVRSVLERNGIHRLEWKEHPEWGKRWYGLDKTGLPVEFFFAGESPVSQREYERRRSVKDGRHAIEVISPEDLVLRKLVNCRLRAKRDFEDAVSVLRVQGDAFDSAYVREHCGVYRICGLFSEAQKESRRQERESHTDEAKAIRNE
jgi:hypothetical protein